MGERTSAFPVSPVHMTKELPASGVATIVALPPKGAHVSAGDTLPPAPATAAIRTAASERFQTTLTGLSGMVRAKEAVAPDAESDQSPST